jgi:hypothetical protein
MAMRPRGTAVRFEPVGQIVILKEIVVAGAAVLFRPSARKVSRKDLKNSPEAREAKVLSPSPIAKYSASST